MSKVSGSLVEAQKRLLRKPVAADITIKCGDRTWKCQSAILSQRCEFFRIASSGGFQESKSRIITLDDDNDADGVDLMLVYLYTLEVPPIERTGEAEKCMSLGDKYNLPALRNAGYDFILSSISRHISRWCSLTEYGKRQWVDFFGRLWTWDIDGSDSIRTAVTQELVHVGSAVIEYSPFQELLEVHPAFNLAFVRAVVKVAADDPS